MTHTTKLLGMTAAVALLSAPALADNTYPIDTDFDGTAEYVIEMDSAEGSLFASMDNDNNGVISRKEYYRNVQLPNEAEAFALYDSDQSGEITPTELYTNSKFGNGRLTDTAGKKYRSNSGQKIGSMRTKFYIDQDQPTYEIDAVENQDEIVRTPIRFEYKAKPNQTTFQRLDDNNDGAITQTEFMKNTQHNNEAAVFAMFDKNQDDVISEYELTTFEKTGGRR